MSTQAKKRSQSRIAQKLKQYQEKVKPELGIPDAGILEKMSFEDLVSWVRKNIRRTPANPTTVPEAEVALCYALRKKKVNGRPVSFRKIENILRWQDRRHGKYAEDYCKGRGRSARRAWFGHKSGVLAPA